MLHVIVGLLLDDGGRQLARAFAAVALVVLMALLLAVTLPAALLAGAGVDRLGPGAANTALRSSAVSSLQAHQVNPPSPAGSAPVEVARRYLGVPYVFGGSNPAIGLDCSGLVQLVFRQLGIPLPRTAQLQYDATVRVPRDQLRPGDLVFFARTYADPHDFVTHVGIYVGDGQQISAPTEGQRISIHPVFTGFWGDHYAGAGRPGAT